MPHVRLSFAVANICGNPVMPIEHVEEDLARLIGMAADVSAAVEISRRDYKHAFRAAFEAVGQTVYGLDSEEPTATRQPVSRSWVRKVTDGVARISPPRFNAGTRLDVALPLLVIAKHPVSGANRHGAAARRTFGMKIRRRLFGTDARKTARLILRRNLQGTSVVVLQDSNNIEETVYTPGQVVASHRGLMWITIHPAPGVKVHLGDELVIPPSELHTDHPMVSREITLTKENR